MKKYLFFFIGALCIIILISSFTANALFSDIDDHSYQEAVLFLEDREIVHGYPDGTFRPENAIKRGELIKIVLQDFDLDLQPRDCLQDVSKQLWYSKYACEGLERGIIQGYPDGTFRGGNDVNFVEALKMTFLAYGYRAAVNPTEWYQNYVRQAEENHFIPPTIRSFDQKITRGEMADMITRFMKFDDNTLAEYEQTLGLQFQVTYDCLKNSTCPESYNIAGNGDLQGTSPYIFALSKQEIEEFLETPVPQTIVEEKIIFTVNKEFADKYPHWKKGAEDIITSVNSVLAKNTQKRFRIERYMTYNSSFDTYADFSDFIYDVFRNDPDSDYHLANRADPESEFGGTTIMFYVTPDAIVNREPLPPATTTTYSIYGKNYSVVNMFYNDGETMTGLHGKEYLQQTLGQFGWDTQYYQLVTVMLHELGHTLGLANPDWYEFNYSDWSPDPPSLDLPSAYDRYPFDPMNIFMYLPDIEKMQFSDINAFIINRNLYKQLTGEEIASLLVKNVIVRVKNGAGNPIPNATVKIYGIDDRMRDLSSQQDKHARDYFLLRQTVRTDSNGEVDIKAPVGNLADDIKSIGAVFYSEVIKVEKDGKVGGGYVDSIMLQEARIMDGLDVYYLDIVIQ